MPLQHHYYLRFSIIICYGFDYVALSLLVVPLVIRRVWTFKLGRIKQVIEAPRSTLLRVKCLNYVKQVPQTVLLPILNGRVEEISSHEAVSSKFPPYQHVLLTS